MGSNQDWYPFHSKSIGKITTELLPVWNGDATNTATGRSANPQDQQQKQDEDVTSKVVLLLDASVFVHTNDQVVMDDEKQQPNFRATFDHSLQLYFAFWGFENLQTFLEETSGFENPVLDSVRVGNTTIMGRDSDGNPVTTISGIQESSSAQGLKDSCLLTMLVIFVTSALYCL